MGSIIRYGTKLWGLYEKDRLNKEFADGVREDYKKRHGIDPGEKHSGKRFYGIGDSYDRIRWD